MEITSTELSTFLLLTDTESGSKEKNVNVLKRRQRLNILSVFCIDVENCREASQAQSQSETFQPDAGDCSLGMSLPGIYIYIYKYTNHTLQLHVFMTL